MGKGNEQDTKRIKKRKSKVENNRRKKRGKETRKKKNEIRNLDSVVMEKKREKIDEKKLRLCGEK